MKTLKKVRKIKVESTPISVVRGGCTEECHTTKHTIVGGVDYGPGLVCTFCY